LHILTQNQSTRVGYSHNEHVLLDVSLLSWCWSRGDQQGEGSIHQPDSRGKSNVALRTITGLTTTCFSCTPARKLFWSFSARAGASRLCCWPHVYGFSLSGRSLWSCWASLKRLWLNTTRSTAARRVSGDSNSECWHSEQGATKYITPLCTCAEPLIYIKCKNNYRGQ